MKVCVGLIVVGLLVPHAASAQVTLNPKTVEFAPSSDHATVDLLTGTPLVSSYVMDCTGVGGTAINKDLGKPAAVANLIGPLTIPEFLTLKTGVAYTCTITVAGPAGNSVPTLPSLPLGIAGPLRIPNPVPTRPVIK